MVALVLADMRFACNEKHVAKLLFADRKHKKTFYWLNFTLFTCFLSNFRRFVCILGKKIRRKWHLLTGCHSTSNANPYIWVRISMSPVIKLFLSFFNKNCFLLFWKRFSLVAFHYEKNNHLTFENKWNKENECVFRQSTELFKTWFHFILMTVSL